ncbi:MAG: DMT family transporter, partial [Chitinophagales bacterium]
ILEPMIFRVKPHMRELMLGLLVMIGISFIFQFDPHFRQGILVGLVAALLGSIFPILNRKLLQRIDAESLTTYELSGGFIFLSMLLPIYLKAFPANYIFPVFWDWIWLLVLSWVCTVLAFNLSMFALKKISAFTVNLTFNLEPIYGITLAFFIFREDKYLSRGFYLGFSLILLAIIWQMASIFRDSGRGFQLKRR